MGSKVSTSVTWHLD